MTAKACIVDDIRDYLYRIGSRSIGLDGLARQIHYPASDVYAALRYLRARDEVIHEKHRGWRYIPSWEAGARQRALGVKQ